MAILRSEFDSQCRHFLFCILAYLHDTYVLQRFFYLTKYANYLGSMLNNFYGNTMKKGNYSR